MVGELIHRTVQTNGINMHIAEQGKGPLVLLLHGFPEIWFSWRHQISQLANHGYHAVAPDLRGFGETDSPNDFSSYTYFHLVGDIIGLLDQLGEEQAFVVGHDWGAEVAWNLCRFRPDRVRALVNFCVPLSPRSPVKPVEMLTQMFGEGLYISQFQEPGRAEKAFAQYDCLTIMKKFLLYDKPDLLIAPPGKEIIDVLTLPSSLPPWITEEEIKYFASKFEKSGFTGGFNYYRAMNLNWELLAPWQGAKITIPVKFIIGDKDIGFKFFRLGEAMKNFVPDLEVVVIDGHHFINQEKAREVNDEIVSFFGKYLVCNTN